MKKNPVISCSERSSEKTIIFDSDSLFRESVNRRMEIVKRSSEEEDLLESVFEWEWSGFEG